MVFFSGKETTAEGVFAAVAYLLTDQDKTKTMGSRVNIGDRSLTTLHQERICLEWLAMEAAASNVFGAQHTHKKTKLLNGVYKKVYRQYHKLSPKVAAAFEDVLAQRRDEYSGILRSSDQPETSIAEAFASHCRIPGEGTVIQAINEMFASQTKAYQDMFSTYF
jgi:hypothetical protein